MITTVLTIILGLADGRPAQTITREWPARQVVATSAQAECDAARMDVLRALQQVMERNPTFVVSIRCEVERRS